MDLWFLEHLRVKCKYQSSPLLQNISTMTKRVVYSEKERKLALGKVDLSVKRMRSPSNYVLVSARAQPCVQGHK